MNDPQVCMFCRYRRMRDAGAAACCAAREALATKPETAGRAVQGAVQGAARALPERLRYPAPRPR